MSALRTITFALCLIVAIPQVKAQTADEIIAKHIDAMGGKAKLQSINTVYWEGTAVTGNGMELEFKNWRAKDKLFRQEISFGMGNIVMIVTPTNGWASNPRSGGEFKPLPDEVQKAMRLQLDVPSPLVDYAAKGHKVELLGKDTVGGKTCYKIKLTPAAGNEVTYYFDTQSYYILREGRKGGGLMGGGGGRRDPNAELNLDFSDYQKTPDGYFFPFTINTGGVGAKTSITKVEFNKPVDVEKLSKPAN